MESKMKSLVKISILSNSSEQTFELGQQISKHLIPGSIIALHGTLGSGKTMLTKGITAGLGIKDSITSPTYTIINEYQLPKTLYSNGKICSLLYHIDLYRLNDSKGFEDIGGIDILNSDEISIIEWSERIINILPADIISISLDITGNESRNIEINGLQQL